MLPQKHRLSLRKELKRIKKNGRMVTGPFFGLLFCQRPQKKPARFGFIVSTKIDKKAVKRNKICRWLQEAVQVNLSQVESGFDAVFLVKKKITNQDFLTLKNEVERVFKKARLIK